MSGGEGVQRHLTLQEFEPLSSRTKLELRFGKTNVVSGCRTTHRREALEAGTRVQRSGKMRRWGKEKEETIIY